MKNWEFVSLSPFEEKQKIWKIFFTTFFLGSSFFFKLTNFFEEKMGQGQSIPEAKYNVAVLGAAGGIGQPLSLLMKQSKYIKSLRLCA